GPLDVAVAGNTPSGVGIVTVLLGNGDGTFLPAKDYTVGDDLIAMVTGDFNRDGWLDLAVVDGGDPFGNGSGVRILLINRDGTFRPGESEPVGGTPSALVTGVFRGDGKLDLAVASKTSNSVSVLLGNGDGTFLNVGAFPAGIGPRALVAGDFNGDGRLDLAVADALSNG